MDLGAFRQNLEEAAHLVDVVQDEDALAHMGESDLENLTATFAQLKAWVRSVATELAGHVKASGDNALGEESLGVFDGIKAGAERIATERQRRLTADSAPKPEGWEAFEPPTMRQRASAVSVRWTKGWPFSRRTP